VPTELYDSISLLHAVGALEAAGFVAVSVDGGAYDQDGNELPSA